MSEAVPIPPDARPCANCGRPLLGPHCYACGQPVKGLVRHFGSIIGDFFDSVFEYDSRTVRTIGPLLLRPGRLSLEYFAGRRVAYVSPVRLFVFLCLVSFFILTFVVDTDLAGTSNEGRFHQAQTVEDVERIRGQALASLEAGLQRVPEDRAERAAQRLERQRARLQSEADRHLEWLRLREQARAAGLAAPPPPSARSAEPSMQFNDREWDAETNPLRFDSLPDAVNDRLNRMLGRAKDNIGRVQEQPGVLVETFLQTLPQTLFVLLPLFALLLKVFYLFKRRLYMEHLIVALHSHAFLCLALLIGLALGGLRGLFDPGLVHGAIGLLQLALLLWVPIYLFLTQKRVYGQGWIMTTLKFAMIGFCYMMLLLFGVMVNLMTNLVTM
jgi:hypothetical protein